MKKKNANFINWFETLEQFEKTYYVSKIRKECHVSRACVYRWIAGDHAIKFPYQAIINSIAGLNLFEDATADRVLQEETE